MTFRFVGSSCELGNGMALSTFGAPVELLQTDAERFVVEHRAALIPDALFAKTGFTKEELAAWPSVQLHFSAPPEFIAKRDAAWMAAHDYRESLKSAPAEKEGE
jgi:hypothetical protein